MSQFCVCECCLPYPAPLLTVDNVYEAMKTVRLSWRELASWLMKWYDPYVEDQKKLDAIEREHVSDEARMQAVVAAFLQGKGPFQPSWRMLVHRLHKVGETDVWLKRSRPMLKHTKVSGSQCGEGDN